MSELLVVRLGGVEYRAALALQEAVRARRQADELPDVLLLLEHPPVYTRGRRSQPGDLPFAPEWYAEQGIDVVPVDRGGQLTYHGPGQLVGYPIVHVQDIIAYVRALERALVAALADEGIAARSRCDEGPVYTGVWVEDRKIASIGIHVAHHVTTHGFAVNVENDMRPFEWAVACGLPDVAMTSIADEHGDTKLTHPPASEPLAHHRDPSPTFTRFTDRAAHRLAEALGHEPREAEPSALGIDTASLSRTASTEGDAAAAGPVAAAANRATRQAAEPSARAADSMAHPPPGPAGAADRAARSSAEPAAETAHRAGGAGWDDVAGSAATSPIPATGPARHGIAGPGR